MSKNKPAATPSDDKKPTTVTVASENVKTVTIEGAAPTTPVATTEGTLANAPAAAQPPAMTNEEILDALVAQIDTLDVPNMDSEAAKKWLSDFKIPLASMTTNALIGLVQSRVAGTSDAVLEETLRALSPAELNQVLRANVAALEKIKDERVREAVLIRHTHEKLTSIAASFVMNALLRVLGVPIVAAAASPQPNPTA